MYMEHSVAKYAIAPISLICTRIFCIWTAQTSVFGFGFMIWEQSAYKHTQVYIKFYNMLRCQRVIGLQHLHKRPPMVLGEKMNLVHQSQIEM